MILLKRILTNPFIILFSIVLGIYLGLNSKDTQLIYAPLGQGYLSLLQMCILPIIITAITSSLGNLLHSNMTNFFLRRMVGTFIGSILLVVILTLPLALAVKPGSHLSQYNAAALGQHIASVEQSSTISNALTAETTTNSLTNFLHFIIPNNIFTAISSGQNLPTLLFFIFLGIALGTIKSQAAQSTLLMLDSVYSAMLKIVNWILLALPIGLCFLFAGYVGQIGVPTLIALSRLLILYLVISVTLMIIYFLVMLYYAKDFHKVLATIKTPLLVALGTSSSFAAMPAILTNVQKNLGLDKRLTDLVVPLSVNLNQPGTILKFLLISFFVTYVYQGITPANVVLIIAFTSILAGMASSGVPGIVAVSVFAIILQPLGLPILTGIIILTAFEPIVDPFVTMTNVFANCAATTFIINKPLPQETLAEDEVNTNPNNNRQID